jgi:hypothetical protein
MPVVLLPVNGTAKPAVRAKSPPLVIGRTIGNLVSRLNASGETIKTGRRPLAHALGMDQARPAKFRRDSSEKLAAGRLGIEPLAFLFAAPSLRTAFCEQFGQGIAGSTARFYDHPSVFERDTGRGSRVQVQGLE